MYDGLMFAANLGVYAGVKPGAFSISLNSRNGNETDLDVFTNIASIFVGNEDVGQLIRRTLDICNSFECAVALLSVAPLDDFTYLLVAGVNPYEGAVIARDRLGFVHIDMLSYD